MSMQTDRIFIAALAADAGINADVAGRIYSTAIPMPDEEAENVPLPYIIVTFDGMENDEKTKDDIYEGAEDKVKIGVMVVARTRDALAALVEKVRTAIPTFFTEYESPEDEEEEDLSDLIPGDYTLTAGAVSYDADKPCYWLQLNYDCITNK